MWCRVFGVKRAKFIIDEPAAGRPTIFQELEGWFLTLGVTATSIEGKICSSTECSFATGQKTKRWSPLLFVLSTRGGYVLTEKPHECMFAQPLATKQHILKRLHESRIWQGRRFEPSNSWVVFGRRHMPSRTQVWWHSWSNESCEAFDLRHNPLIKSKFCVCKFSAPQMYTNIQHRLSLSVIKTGFNASK